MSSSHDIACEGGIKSKVRFVGVDLQFKLRALGDL
jgi:hypothetical protein